MDEFDFIPIIANYFWSPMYDLVTDIVTGIGVVFEYWVEIQCWIGKFLLHEFFPM